MPACPRRARRKVSDLYPIPLSAAAALAYAYSPAAFQPAPGGDWNRTQHDFLLAWARRQYGDAAAPDAAALYAGYFEIPYLQQVCSAAAVVAAGLGPAWRGDRVSKHRSCCPGGALC